MDTTDNFLRGLALAYESRRSEGLLTRREQKVITRFLNMPRGAAHRQVHRMVRHQYIKDHPLIGAIDWTTVVDWIKANWNTILRIILTILPFLIL